MKADNLDRSTSPIMTSELEVYAVAKALHQVCLREDLQTEEPHIDVFGFRYIIKAAYSGAIDGTNEEIRCVVLSLRSGEGKNKFVTQIPVSCDKAREILLQFSKERQNEPKR